MSTPIGPENDPPPAERAGRAPALAVEDFRSLRRWLVLLGLISVLAAAGAAFAVVKANESENEAADEDRLTLLERSLDRRIAAMDKRLATTNAQINEQQRRLRRAGEESDVTRLDSRLRRVENDSADAVEAAADASDELGRIERRLAALRRDVRRLE